MSEEMVSKDDWGRYRNMARMSKVPNVSYDVYLEHFRETRNTPKEAFKHFHEVQIRRTIEGLAFRIDCNVTLEKK